METPLANPDPHRDIPRFARPPAANGTMMVIGRDGYGSREVRALQALLGGLTQALVRIKSCWKHTCARIVGTATMNANEDGACVDDRFQFGVFVTLDRTRRGALFRRRPGRWAIRWRAAQHL
jgi:hypothetical protein